jgi:MFS family permease
MFLGSHLIDRIGRRRILLLTLPLMVVALCGLSTSYLLPDNTAAGAALALASIILFKIGYSPGMGPIPPVIESEIFGPDVRALGLTVASVFGAVFNIIILQTFPALQDAAGTVATFFIFAGLTVCAEVFVYLAIVETKQMQLEDTYKALLQPSATSVADNGDRSGTHQL